MILRFREITTPWDRMVPRCQPAYPGLRCACREIEGGEAILCCGPAGCQTAGRRNGSKSARTTQHRVLVQQVDPHPVPSIISTTLWAGQGEKGVLIARGSHLGCWKVAMLKVNRASPWGVCFWRACIIRLPCDSINLLLRPVRCLLLCLQQSVTSGRAESTWRR